MKRFNYSLAGLVTLFKKDSHFIIHVIIAFIVLIISFIFKLNTTEWLFIVSAIFVVLILETMNSSIEYTVDLITFEYHELARKAKDVASFAVLLASLYAVCVGLIIFIPKIF